MEAAYLAGLFDGEGTVGIYETWTTHNGKRTPTWIYQVQIANTSLRVLEFVQSKMGGSVVPKSKGKAHWRPGYVWRLCGEQAAKFMREIRPYTIIKSAEIDEALRFREFCGEWGGQKQTEAQLAGKREICANLKVLKRAV